MKKFFVVFFVVIMVLSFTISAFAGDMPTSGQRGTYPAGPIQKAERGFNNAIFGWTELPKKIVDVTKASNPIKGLLIGGWQGTWKAFARTVSGVSEVITFPLGSYDKPKILPDMPAVEQ